MKDVSGKEISFKEVMKKNGLLVMFSCNTCPVVGKYQSRTLETGKFAMDNEIGVIVLNSNEATRGDGESFEDMQQYGKEQGYKFNYVVDKNSEMADAFGATRTPEVFLFDKTGKLVYHGAIDDNANGPDKVTRQTRKDRHRRNGSRESCFDVKNQICRLRYQTTLILVNPVFKTCTKKVQVFL